MERAATEEKTGVWLVGALGSLATTVIVGTEAIRKGLAAEHGMVTAHPEFQSMGLVSLEHLVFGGHEIRDGSLIDSAREIQRLNGSLRHEWMQELEPELERVSRRIRRGPVRGCGTAIEQMGTPETTAPRSLRALADELIETLRAFQQENGCSRLVVVNLASTEPRASDDRVYATLAALEARLDSGHEGDLRPGALYAYAAFQVGAAFLNFTPSRSCLCPANQELAAQHDLPFMGNDGKTGETLVKSALAPMFKYRNLKVHSWVGYNILGNRDGQVLADDDNKRSKIDSKDSVLSSILRYPLQTHVGIDYVPSLADSKVAWDFIHFQGFLDYNMSMQFTWQGCDSILAAPLVLDLIRFADHALVSDSSGAMLHLASFFKSPLHCAEHDLHRQFHMLTDYLAKHSVRL